MIPPSKHDENSNKVPLENTQQSHKPPDLSSNSFHSLENYTLDDSQNGNITKEVFSEHSSSYVTNSQHTLHETPTIKTSNPNSFNSANSTNSTVQHQPILSTLDSSEGKSPCRDAVFNHVTTNASAWSDPSNTNISLIDSKSHILSREPPLNHSTAIDTKNKGKSKFRRTPTTVVTHSKKWNLKLKNPLNAYSKNKLTQNSSEARNNSTGETFLLNDLSPTNLDHSKISSNAIDNSIPLTNIETVDFVPPNNNNISQTRKRHKRHRKGKKLRLPLFNQEINSNESIKEDNFAGKSSSSWFNSLSWKQYFYEIFKDNKHNRLRKRRSNSLSSDSSYSSDAEQIPPLSDSRYPEVRASVPNTDDFEMAQNTVRMWVIGLIMTTIGCILNTIFYLHSPVFVISTFVASMVAWPLGRLWEKLVPNYTFLNGRIQLNPGPFNLKEHALITIMATISFGDGAAYMADIVLTLRHFYKIDFGWGFSIIGIITTQAIGYSFAGIMRRILIYPASMIWPSTLVTTTFLTNIHLNINHVANGWHISRFKFFAFVMLGCFLWSWIPGFLAPFLSDFGFLTWITPDNVVINQLFGTRSGLGLLPLTFDWNQIAGYIGSPLIPPFFAIGNILASIVIIFWIVTPIIHFSNVWFGHYLPMSSNDTYDRFQHVYNVTKVLTPDSRFDLEKYQSYSAIFLPTTFAVAYGMSFASISSTITHTVLFHGKELLFYWRHSRNEPDDIHMHLMKRYKEAPDWWYWLSLIIFLSMSIVLVRVWDTGLPVYALLLALAIAGVMVIPIGMIYALTNMSIGLNVITEFIIGYLVPGRPIAMMLFKTFGYITNYQAVGFLEGMKLGHYMKISPRILFFAQLIATLWGGIVQLASLYWAENNIVNICMPYQSASFTCPAAHVFFNASVIWGVVGPQRYLSSGQLYNKTLYFFLVGALLPIFTWFVLKKYPKSPLRHIHWPVFFTGTGLIPPATPYTYGAYCAVGYVFGYFVKRNYFAWWAKYNYTLSAGLDLGLAWASLIVFIITLSPKVSAPSWWGTNVIQNTADARMDPMIQLPEGQAFGPSTW